MRPRLISLFVTAVLAIATLMPALPVVAASDSTTSPRVSDLIVAGLWAGINVAPPGSAAGAVTPTTSPASPTYVALGDSVAAGVGLPTAAPSAANPVGCARTTEAYPYEVARVMGLPLTHTACSGATVRDLYTVQLAGAALVPAQLNTAFHSGTPQLMTLTAGANDVYWEYFLRTCASAANCASAASTDFANGRLITIQKRLIYAFDQIRTRSGNRPPTVVVTGYYNPVSPACANVRPTLTTDEVRWMTAAVDALNQTIRQVAARYAFVRYAAVDFTGHDICSSQSWVQGLESTRPIHPTIEGQRVIARSVLATLGH